jgi:hypothetical protein
MDTQLLSCPFCYGDQLIVARQVNSYHVFCEQCCATGPKHLLQESAIRDWFIMLKELQYNPTRQAQEFISRLKFIENKLAVKKTVI